MKRTLAGSLAGLLLLVAGCASDDGEASEEAVVVDIQIKDGEVTPLGDRVDVTVGDTITLHIASDAEEAIHVHTEPEHEFEVKPGDSVKKSFTVYSPGLVAIEAHHLDTTIVRLIVRP